MRIEGTELFVGDRQIVRVSGVRGPVQVRGDGVAGRADGDGVVEVPVAIDAAPGTVVPVSVTAGGATGHAELVVAEPGWTVWMVSHFHYDPVWWNTQAAYTATWGRPEQTGTEFRADFQRTGFELVRLHLETARLHPEYKFVLAELDYLKPYWDACPQDRAYLRRLLREGRLELVGGTYNEPNTNLTLAETTIRNFRYGIGFQRDVVGGDPRTAWQLDAFGHDPNFPGLAAAAGLDSSSWARGPFHQWGPMLSTYTPGERGWGDPSSMQFTAEFEWLSPSGRGVLTHYMPAHYSSGWHIDAQPTLAAAQASVYRLFLLLKKVARTRNVLLPVGTDYSPPAKWVVDIHRDWNARYTWPRFVCGLPREFFAAVREQADGFSPQTRDMNPIYTGKDVSFIDTKQAQRHAEALLTDAETFATLAALGGAPFPHEETDLAWRQLVFGAHHDGITGSESDQVYLDLLTGWRQAHDLAAGVLDGALGALSARLPGGDGPARIAVFNPSSWTRTDVVRTPLPDGLDGALVDGEPALVEDGHLVFLARDVPGVGYRTFALSAADGDGWRPRPGATAIENETFRLTVDPAHGGAVASLVDRRTGRELLAAGRHGNELLVYDEYPAHPRAHEGPWHLLPKGPATAGSTAGPAHSVTVETGPLGERVTVAGAVGPARYTQTLTLWHGVARVDARTRLAEFTGADHLVRVRWPCHVPGALPVSEVGNAVVGRGFGILDADTETAPWTLDNPAQHWFALSSTARVHAGAHTRAIGVAEIVVGDTLPTGARDLALALVRQGVTATCSVGDGPRYGSLAVDSNLPDVRIAIGGPAANPFTAAVLAAAGAHAQRRLREDGRVWIPAERPLAEVWTPNADLTGVRALPVLVVAEDAVARLCADVDAGDVRVAPPLDDPDPDPDPDLDDYTVGIVNRGLPGFAVDRGGALHLSLVRSCTGWPSGVWIDPPRRTAPDGSNFQQQHWTHEFDYSIVAGDGDWRAAGLVAAGHAVNHPLHARAVPAGPPASARLVQVEPPTVVLTALKPAGDPIASGEVPEPVSAVTARYYESAGRPANVHIGLPVPVVSRQPVDLLERPVPDGALPAAGIGQCVLGVARPLPAAFLPAAPVYSRYWLHNAGPAPLGNMPVSVHLDPPHAAVCGPVALTATVACDLTAARAAGTLSFAAPPGWTVEPPSVPFDLEPGGHVVVPLLVTPPPEPEPGAHWLRASIPQGPYDVTRLLVGVSGPETVTAALAPAALRLRRGESASLTLRLGTDAVGEVLVDVHLIGPWHTWELLPVARRSLTLRGSSTVEFPVRVPAGHPPGQWWVLARLAHAGQLHYTEPVPVTVLP
ncbi:glycoside hydrolase family 38 C-terminal domain-containing protein [Dactylosporangium sp. NPDC048998]|uniref:glycoside hydrolase family 38 N-terminal domain-containing protein n=1 Tax=Dactylosporangium sp. NPDC048998 TaxID=3363976 RepID=UPI003718B9E5